MEEEVVPVWVQRRWRPPVEQGPLHQLSKTHMFIDPEAIRKGMTQVYTRSSLYILWLLFSILRDYRVCEEWMSYFCDFF